MRVSKREMQAVMELAGPARHEYLIKRVVDSQVAWGLWHEGWALMKSDEGALVFPLWSAPEYAEACASGDFAGYSPRSIPLSDILQELLPKLRLEGISLAVFPTPAGRGVVTSGELLARALAAEGERYL
jgi:hypothetical protein